MTYVLLGLSVMLSIFSRAELPTLGMGYALRGQFLGISAALVCQLSVWPHLSSTLAQVCAILPFLAIGMVLAMKVNPLLIALEYHMGLLLLLQPKIPFERTFSQAGLIALSVLAAPALAWLCYRTIFPVHLQRRQTHLAQSFEAQLRHLALNPPPLARLAEWKTRFAHRGLCLVQLNSKLNLPKGETLALVRYFADWAHLGIQAAHMRQNPEAPAFERDFAQQILTALQQPSDEGRREALKKLPKYSESAMFSALQVVLGPASGEEF